MSLECLNSENENINIKSIKKSVYVAVLNVWAPCVSDMEECKNWQPVQAQTPVCAAHCCCISLLTVILQLAHVIFLGVSAFGGREVGFIVNHGQNPKLV